MGHRYTGPSGSALAAMPKDFRRIAFDYVDAGWTITIRRNNHLRWTHPNANGPVFTSATPSDHRALQRIRRDLRNALKNRTR